MIEGPSGRRVMPIRDFFTGPYETAVGDGELLVQLRVPISSSASAYDKVERRAGDWAVAAAGAELRIEGTQVVSAGIGLTALGAPGFHAPEAEEYLIGGPAVDERFAEAGRIAAQHCNPVADQRGPADYKRHLAEVLTVRALRKARTRWHGDHDGED